LNARDKQDVPVIGHLAAAKVEKLKELLKLGAHFDAKTDGPTLLMEAAHMGNLEQMTYILSLGVDTNATGTWNKEANMHDRPLQTAITFGHFDAAKLLVAHGAKIDSKDVQNALCNNRKDIVRFFWEQGARTISELTYQISQGAKEADIQKLLDAGASANPPQDSPYSPLALASELGRLDLVQLLVEHGAMINPASVGKDNIWDSPIDDAAWEGQDEVVAFLLKHGAKAGYQALWNVAWNVNPYEGEQRSKDHFEKTLKLLIDANALNNLSPEEKGRLLDAVIDTRNPGGNLTALKMLLAAGLSPNLPMTDEKGKNYGIVLSYYRDLRAKNPQDNFNIFPLIDLLEAAANPTPASHASDSPAPAQPASATGAPAAMAAPDKTIQKLQTLVFDHVDFEHQDILDVIQQLTHKSKDVDPEKEGVSFVVRLDSGSPPKPDLEIHRDITLHLHNATLAEVLGNIIQQTKLTYAFEEYAIYLRPPSVDANTLVVRTFHVPANFLSATLPGPGDTTSADGKTQVVTNRLMLLGFKFSSGAVANYCPGSGMLVVSNTPEQLDLIAEYLKRLSPAETADRAPSPSTSNRPRSSVQIGLKLLAIDDHFYQANKAQMDAAVERGDIAYFVNLEHVSMLSTPSVTTTPGRKANIEIVREFPYPTQFEPSKLLPNQKVAVAGSGTQTLTLMVPPTPREFVTRDVGVSAEITPTINDTTTLAPGKIVLLGKVSVCDFEGFAKSNVEGVAGMPSFNTSESNFLEQLGDGESKGVWIPGLHAEEPPAPDKNAPPYASTNPGASVKRMLLFVSAVRVP
jgi:ankyrin repeat protein